MILEIKGFKSSYSVEDLKGLPFMKYWSLPAGSSAAQKAKLKTMPGSGKYIASLKKDGAAYKFIKDENGNVSLTSRTESKKTEGFVDKTANFPKIVNQLSALPNGSSVIVELYFTDLSKGSKDITKITGSLPKRAIELQKTMPVRAYVHDVLALDGIMVDRVPAELRFFNVLETVKEYLKDAEDIDFAEFVTENLDDFISTAIANGEEGVVLVEKNQPYHFKSAPAWSYIKYKKNLTDDLDLVIIGTYPAQEKYSGKNHHIWQYWKNLKTGELVEGSYYTNGGYEPVSQYFFEGKIGGLILGAYRAGVLTEVARISNITDDIRDIATENSNSLIGTVVEVTCMEVLPTGGLRHAKIKRYRDSSDKLAKDCLWEHIF